MLKAELINFEWHAADTCKKCDLNYRYWGRFRAGIVNESDFTVTGQPPNDMTGKAVPYSHLLSWMPENVGDSANFSGNITLAISLPPQTQKTACKDTLRFCIRYSLAFMHYGSSISCSTIRCYDTRRDHVQLQPSATLPAGLPQKGPDILNNNK